MQKIRPIMTISQFTDETMSSLFLKLVRSGEVREIDTRDGKKSCMLLNSDHAKDEGTMLGLESYCSIKRYRPEDNRTMDTEILSFHQNNTVLPLLLLLGDYDDGHGCCTKIKSTFPLTSPALPEFFLPIWKER